MGKTVMTSYDENVKNMRRNIRAYFENRSQVQKEIDRLKVEEQQVRDMKKQNEQALQQVTSLSEEIGSAVFHANQLSTIPLMKQLVSMHTHTLTRLESELKRKEQIIKDDQRVQRPIASDSIQGLLIQYLNHDLENYQFISDLVNEYGEADVFTLVFHALASHGNMVFLHQISEALNRDVEDQDLFYLLVKRAHRCCEER